MTQPTTSLLSRGLAAAWFALAALPLGAQTRHDVIRGRIVTDSGRPVANAVIRAQRAPDRAGKSAQTDAGGLFSIDWPDGSGGYRVTVTAAGRPTLSRRATRTGTHPARTPGARPP